ncbi:Rieske (2Fe-2S) protein [Candidatus Woesearchaeota archaeon]|nr:Rieske (2Fe-2S) protein [Candidatus Woesearchaeota archaeon]
MEKIGKVADFQKPKCVMVKGKEIACFLVDGKIHCIENACPHAGGPLCEGDLAEFTVTCPWHGWSFDVRSGDAVNPQYAAGATAYKVEVKGDDVFIDM